MNRKFNELYEKSKLDNEIITGSEVREVLQTLWHLSAKVRELLATRAQTERTHQDAYEFVFKNPTRELWEDLASQVNWNEPDQNEIDNIVAQMRELSAKHHNKILNGSVSGQEQSEYERDWKALEEQLINLYTQDE